MARSGCGIIASTLPAALHTAATALWLFPVALFAFIVMRSLYDASKNEDPFCRFAAADDFGHQFPPLDQELVGCLAEQLADDADARAFVRRLPGAFGL